MVRRAPLFAFALLFAFATEASIARADYVAPKKEQGDDDGDANDGEEMPVKKRRIFVVEEEVVAPPPKHLTLAWNPIALLTPMAEFSLEARVVEDFSVALLGGYGKVSVDAAETYTGPSSVPAWELGAEAFYYAQGSFDEGGIQVGLDVRYLRATIHGPARVSGVAAAGLLVGPIVGWKWVVKRGLTIDSMIGVGIIAAKQHADDGAPKEDRVAVLNGALNLGWTF